MDMDPTVIFKMKKRVAHTPPDSIQMERMEMTPHKCLSPGCPKSYKDKKAGIDTLINATKTRHYFTAINVGAALKELIT